MNYTITPIGKPKMAYPAYKKHYENFKFENLVRTSMQYSDEGKMAVRVNIIYSFTCFFPKTGEREPFASCQQTFQIVKDDELDLPYNSEAVFKCVKQVETAFSNYLSSRNPPIPLIGTLVKPITFQSWVSRGRDTGSSYDMN